MTASIDLTASSRRLSSALGHGPHASDWDPETTLWTCDPWADFGITDGRLWATDRVTAAIDRADAHADVDWRSEVGRKVIDLCDQDIPARSYRAELKDLALVGGRGRIPLLGDFNLDLIWQAASWVAGDLFTVLVAPDEFDGQVIVRVFPEDESARRAVVCACRLDGWFPTIGLPLVERVV